jgi:hypothetical protein
MALAVYLDGAPMAEPDARALWQRFSDWMESNRGDLAGFAAKEGFASVHPGVENGRPVLYASKTEGQRPYAAVGAATGGQGGAGGSGGRHEPGNRGSGRRGKPNKSGRKPRS